jgi:hypothetical protein
MACLRARKLRGRNKSEPNFIPDDKPLSTGCSRRFRIVEAKAR